MDLAVILFLALVEGITEFLPISSTAHLILASLFLNLPQEDFLTTFNIAIQFGAILAVSTLYFNTLRKNPHLLLTLAVAFIPAGILGLLFYSFITDTLFESPLVIVTAMGVGGIALVAAEKYLKSHKPNTKSLTDINYKRALGIGAIQALALIPGTSRAASSMVGGLLLGLDRKTAVEFSFLLALPTIGAATTLDLFQNRDTLTQQNLTTLLIGSLLTFSFAYLTMKYFLKYLNKNTLIWFGIYRIILALLSLILLI